MKKLLIALIIFVICSYSIIAQSENDFEIIQKGGGITITGYTGTQTEIVIPAKISGIAVYSIGRSAFSNKKLTKITLPTGLKTIDDSAFANNRLTAVVIPNTVTAIINDAFSDNQITEIVLPNQLTFLGGGAFARNKIENLTIPASLDHLYGGTFRGCPIKTLKLGGVKTITALAFEGAEIEQITISANVTIVAMCGLDVSFINFYNSNGKTSGTYVKNGRIWSKK
jgi:hypothetical protein